MVCFCDLGTSHSCVHKKTENKTLLSEKLESTMITERSRGLLWFWWQNSEWLNTNCTLKRILVALVSVCSLEFLSGLHQRHHSLHPQVNVTSSRLHWRFSHELADQRRFKHEQKQTVWQLQRRRRLAGSAPSREELNIWSVKVWPENLHFSSLH